MPLNNLLDSLTTQELPFATLTVTKLGDVFHHAVLVNIAIVHAIVAPLQSRDMVPDDPGYIDLLHQFAISPIGV